jgi:GT2 family glycosyltransferase/glycosyltransferase involved in cell wall biosynthesis
MKEFVASSRERKERAGTILSDETARGDANAHFSFLLDAIEASQARGDFEQALRYADRAGRLAPGDPLVAGLRGRALAAAGWLAAAASFFSDSLAKRRDIDTSIWLIDVLLAAGRIDDAAHHLAAALHHFAVEVDGPLAGVCRRLLAAPGHAWGGWAGVSSDFSIIGEALLQRGSAIVELRGPDGASRRCNQVTGRAGETVPFRFEAPPVARPEAVALVVDDRAVIGSGLIYPPPLTLDGRTTYDQGRIHGWVSVSWAPSLVTGVLASDEHGGSTRCALEPDPADSSRRQFSFSLGETGLVGNEISVSALLPDGNITPLPDAPLFLKVPPIDASLAASRPARATARRTTKRPKIDIIIPIYRGLEESVACLSSVIETTNGEAQILVIDDASPDPALRRALAGLASSGAVTLLTNPRNLGFPASVNRGLACHNDHDIVLLNADTVVYGDWLARLRAAAYAAPEIGTVTPLSNHGSIVSYPREGTECTVAAAATIDRLAGEFGSRKPIPLPTGVGFCMYIKRDCLAAVGAFDAMTFARGYGEENDFCLRAEQRGWRSVAAANVYVWHQGGRSFGHGEALRERNGRLLRLRYPDYEARIAAFHAEDPVHRVRRQLDEARLLAAGGHYVLVVSLGLSGGVARFVEERCRAVRAAGGTPLIVKPDPEHPPCCVLSGHDELRDLRYEVPRELPALHHLLQRLAIDHVELHHFFGHDGALVDRLIGLDLPYDIYVHDNSWICPRLTLLDGAGRYCGEPDESGCRTCIDTYGSRLDEPLTTAELRQRSARWLAMARDIIVPSGDMARRLNRYFPGAKLRLMPWETELAPQPIEPVAGRTVTRVAVIGAIGEHKGYGVVLACARDAAARALPLEFVVIGYTQDDAALLELGNAFVTGKYEESEIADLLRREGPNVVFFPSITPESWCYTLSHGLRTGLPIVAFDLGAIAERLRAAARGRLLPMTADSAEINDLLLEEAKPTISAQQPAAAATPAHGEPGAVKPPASDPQPSASVQVVTVPAGLYAFRVRSGTPMRPSGPEGMVLPAVNVGLAPGQAPDAVEFLSAPGTAGNWLYEAGHTLVARVQEKPATFLLTSLRLPDGPLLSIAVDRLDLPNLDVAGAQRLELPAEPTTIDVSALQTAKPAATAGASEPADGLRLSITAHVQRWGDTEFSDALWAGHVGQRLWIEAFSVKPLEGITPDQLEYKGLTAAGYETPWLSNGAPCGTRGMAMPLVGFAVRVKPGADAPAYDCEYSGAFLSGATIGPRRNGAPCFSTPEDPLEAIQLKIVPRERESSRGRARASGAANGRDGSAAARRRGSLVTKS